MGRCHWQLQILLVWVLADHLCLWWYRWRFVQGLLVPGQCQLLQLHYCYHHGSPIHHQCCNRWHLIQLSCKLHLQRQHLMFQNHLVFSDLCQCQMRLHLHQVSKCQHQVGRCHWQLLSWLVWGMRDHQCLWWYRWRFVQGLLVPDQCQLLHLLHRYHHGSPIHHQCCNRWHLIQLSCKLHLQRQHLMFQNHLVFSGLCQCQMRLHLHQVSKC